MSKCPVCKTDYPPTAKRCSNCGFDQLSKEFINQDELMHWLEETVAPCQRIYRAMSAKLEAVSNNSLRTVLQPVEPNNIEAIVDLCNESGDFQYFNYEEESGVVTDPYFENKKSKCAELQRYVNKGLRITGYNGFETTRVIVPSEINGRPVISIGEKVFMNTSLSEIVLPKSLKAILRNAFDGCKNLHNITLPDDITYLGKACFKNSGLSEIKFPNSLNMVPSCCCEEIITLESIVFGNNLKTIDYAAFRGCTKLSSVLLPDSLLQIGSKAFGMTAITTIVFPETVKTLSLDIFYDKDSFGYWYGKNPRQIVCVFLGKNTIVDGSSFANVSLIYCLPGSKIQQFAREHSIPTKPLSDYKTEN